MNTNLKEQQTQVAIKLMETMDLYKPYIKAFKEKGIITLYEDYYFLLPATMSLRDLPGLNLGALETAIFMVAPV